MNRQSKLTGYLRTFNLLIWNWLYLPIVLICGILIDSRLLIVHCAYISIYSPIILVNHATSWYFLVSISFSAVGILIVKMISMRTCIIKRRLPLLIILTGIKAILIIVGLTLIICKPISRGIIIYGI